MTAKFRSLALVTLAQLLALSLWFSGTAAGPAMARDAPLPPGFLAWLTGGVQAGFVLGTLASAALALPDRLDPRRLVAAACLLGAAANAALLLLPPGDPWMIAARGATGLALACIYPVGMKLAAGWAGPRDAGLVVGLLVGGLTLGSGAPHLVNALGGLDWRLTVGAASLGALLGAVLILGVRLGPRHAKAPPFRPGLALELFRGRGTRLATLGYLGHMWELYAMWAWIGAYLAASLGAPRAAGVATFAVLAAGSFGCIAGGLVADRIGRPEFTIWAMGVSAACCLLAGPAFGGPTWLVVALGLVWGAAAVADSAQFSATVAEYAPPGLAGTMLTVQTSLGFALTLPAIHLMPAMEAWLGWGGGAFAVLAAGPLLGCVAMARLVRRRPARA
ncbi:MFS transporter [Siccirubricoccus sp. KC 17139]|uniref:MFS transporter n=1 Tax=Siccirubricoccus soli TaxID=2899147 RepID=A0ABT1CZS5_9PROT|nr:MFS transporter [Siccirubricoccus soli]MCO6414917.1 MFS transporter [Siccirubricoccus soli]MCP2681047.1 MFS transporter [Siccirubricoccus soli]